MSVYLISDLHLDVERPATTERFFDFLATKQSDMSALYVLGDFFEAWVGDDDHADLGLAAQNQLRHLSENGVPIYFQHGNRDFLIGDEFSKRSGCTLLPELHRCELGGAQTLLLHGDTLCTDDVAYQQFRNMVRSPSWQTQFLSQPLPARRAFAQAARAQSASHQQNVREEITDVTDDAVQSLFRADSNLTRIIHGHTHRPMIHTLTVNERAVERIVLPDWYSTGGFVRIDDHQLELVEFDVH